MLQMVSWISHYHLVWTREQESVVDTLVSINYNSSVPLNNSLSTPLCQCLVSIFSRDQGIRGMFHVHDDTNDCSLYRRRLGQNMLHLRPNVLCWVTEELEGATDSISCGNTRIELDNICCQPILKMRLIETNLIVQNKCSVPLNIDLEMYIHSGKYGQIVWISQKHTWTWLLGCHDLLTYFDMIVVGLTPCGWCWWNRFNAIVEWFLLYKILR